MKHRFLFGKAPESVVRDLQRLQGFTNPFLKVLHEKLREFGIKILHANRPTTELFDLGILQPFDYGFAGSNTGKAQVAKWWLTAEHLKPGYHLQYAWGYPELWDGLENVIKKASNGTKVLLFPSYARPQHDKLVADYGDKLVLATPPNYLSRKFGADKRDMTWIYEQAGLEYPKTFNYAEAVEVKDYEFYANIFGEPVVVQASQGAGGLTNNGKRAIFFCANSEEFKIAKEGLAGEGPLRVMKFFKGMSGNSSALALPFGVYVSSRPSTKPCGKVETNAFFGASNGNQWDNRYSMTAILEQYKQLVRVGTTMAGDGYFGIYGLDPVISKDGIVFNSEINPRTQGPDGQRERAAIEAGILSLLTMQLAYYVGVPQELFPDAELYNNVTQYLQVGGYLKIFAPGDFKAKSNINGPWQLVDGTKFEVVGGPQQGEICSAGDGFNLAYLNFTPETVIFDKDGNFTSIALEAVRAVYNAVGVEVSF